MSVIWQVPDDDTLVDLFKCMSCLTFAARFSHLWLHIFQFSSKLFTGSHSYGAPVKVFFFFF